MEEGLDSVNDVWSNNIPVFLKEISWNPIRPWCFVRAKLKYSTLNLKIGNGFTQLQALLGC